MRYCLITPIEKGGNPGCQIITAGIKGYLRKHDNQAEFLTINMVKPDDWAKVEKTADKLVFCGNPRFNQTEAKTYWDWGVWKHILELYDKGMPFIDAWAGSCVGFQEYTSNPNPCNVFDILMGVRKNRDILQFEAKAERLIARDKPTELMFQTVSKNVELIPCCSIYAKNEYRIESGKKDYNLIVLRSLPGNEWLLDKIAKVQKQMSKDKPCILLVTTKQDLEWCQKVKPMGVYEPEELLKLYARTDEMVSFRVHASIPAYSLGAKVTDYYYDSRCETTKLLGIKSLPFTTFGS